MADSSLLKYSLKTNIVKSVFFEIVSKISRYYYTFGKTTPWPDVTAIGSDNLEYLVSNDDNPPAVADTYSYELDTRRNITYMKYIDANDAAIVVPRYNWISGRIYDMYDQYSSDYVSYNGASSIDQAMFYVLTDEFNVYKCLYNGKDSQNPLGSPSTKKPIGNSTEAITLSDGYIWKFMYSIPLSLRNKFLTSSYMPVITALSNQFYSNGSITNYSIENRGKNYIKNSWKIKRFIILNPGNAYSSSVGAFNITFPAPPAGGTTAVAQLGQLNSAGGVESITVVNTGSGYTTQPIPSITTTSGVGLDYVIEYEKDSSAYTQLKVIGDGYNALNPYSLKKVTILDGGIFTEQPSGDLFVFPDPQLAGGRLPEVSVVFSEIQNTGTYTISSITVTDTGYGYSEPLVFNKNVFADALLGSGFSCDLDQGSQKNEAELIPLINSSGEIEAIQISSQAPGVGYTYASVEVVGKKTVLMVAEDPYSAQLVDLSSNPSDPGYVEGFIKAKIIITFGVGDIDSKQSNVELLAVDGSIPVISIDNGGNGYAGSTSITINGDGVGCTADVVVRGEKIVNVVVTNPGSGYTYATATITGSGSNAVLRPIISPRGGHGKDAISELYAKTIMLVTRLSNETNHSIPVDNDYRQITILKNPKDFNSDSLFKKAIGTTCVLLECEVSAANTVSYNAFSPDDTLYFSQNKSFILLEKLKQSNKYYLLVEPVDNYIPISGSTIYKLVGNTAYGISVLNVTPPDVNKYSGEMLYTDNRIKFSSSAEQMVSASTLITF